MRICNRLYGFALTLVQFAPAHTDSAPRRCGFDSQGARQYMQLRHGHSSVFRSAANASSHATTLHPSSVEPPASSTFLVATNAMSNLPASPPTHNLSSSPSPAAASAESNDAPTSTTEIDAFLAAFAARFPVESRAWQSAFAVSEAIGRRALAALARSPRFRRASGCGGRGQDTCGNQTSSGGGSDELVSDDGAIGRAGANAATNVNCDDSDDNDTVSRRGQCRNPACVSERQIMAIIDAPSDFPPPSSTAWLPPQAVPAPPLDHAPVSASSAPVSAVSSLTAAESNSDNRARSDGTRAFSRAYDTGSHVMRFYRYLRDATAPPPGCVCNFIILRLEISTGCCCLFSFALTQSYISSPPFLPPSPVWVAPPSCTLIWVC
jgi:hypothetical protein